MRILAVENSGPEGSVAVVCDGNVVGMQTFTSPRGRGSALFDALASTALLDVDLVLVGTGPGGYNGLRSSIAAAWGFARARKIPMAGVCSLLGYDAPDYFVLGDARAGEWFCGRVTGGHLDGAPELMAPDVAIARIGQDVLPVFCTTALTGLPRAVVQCPRADILAARASEAGPAEPFYLKPPHITKPRPPLLGAAQKPCRG